MQRHPRPAWRHHPQSSLCCRRRRLTRWQLRTTTPWRGRYRRVSIAREPLPPKYPLSLCHRQGRYRSVSIVRELLSPKDPLSLCHRRGRCRRVSIAHESLPHQDPLPPARAIQESLQWLVSVLFVCYISVVGCGLQTTAGFTNSAVAVVWGPNGR